MKNLPFDPYDFFGYLASGFLILITMELVLGFPLVLGQDFKVVDTFALLLAAYVAGQLVATPAKGLLEYGLVEKLLQRPSVNLLRDAPPKFLGMIFRDYYKPLPPRTRTALRQRVGDDDLTDEALFLAIRFAPEIRSDSVLAGRLSTFLNKYGFARNLAFTSLASAAAFIAKELLDDQADLIGYAGVALSVSVLLTYRYLKFFRQYSYELFNTYAAQE